MKFKWMFVGIALLVIAGSAQANINLEWRSAQQTVGVGDTVILGLYAVPDNAQQHLISAMDVLVNWDPTYLSFQSLGDPQPLWMNDGFFIDSDDINVDRTDGDVLYTGMGWLGEPIAIAPQGDLCVEFIFTALAPVATTSVSIVPTMGNWGRTCVYDGTVPNMDVKGTIGSIDITVVPEPSSLIALLAGLCPLMGLRKRIR